MRDFLRQRYCGTAPGWLRPGPSPAGGTGHLLTPSALAAGAPVPAPGDTGTLGPEEKAAWGHHSCPLGTGQIGTCPFSVPLGLPLPVPLSLSAPPDPAAVRRLQEGAARVPSLGAQPRERAALPGAGEKVPRSGSPGSWSWEESPPCPGRGGRGASRH